MWHDYDDMTKIWLKSLSKIRNLQQTYTIPEPCCMPTGDSKISDRAAVKLYTLLYYTLTLVMLNKLRCHPTSNFQPIRLLDPGVWYKFAYLMANSADPKSVGFFRSQLIWIYTVFKGRVYPGSAGQGLITHKALSKIVADDILSIFCIFFRENMFEIPCESSTPSPILLESAPVKLRYYIYSTGNWKWDTCWNLEDKSRSKSSINRSKCNYAMPVTSLYFRGSLFYWTKYWCQNLK